MMLMGGHILIGMNDQGAVIGTDRKLAQESLASALQSIISHRVQRSCRPPVPLQ
ncbi:MAG: hypothetical protein Q7V05_00320 [Methanoregula sp.]|nr:hypothetical protein [Methanoregula sp.]